MTYLESTEAKVLFKDGFLDWAGREGIRPLWEVQREFGVAPSPELEASLRIFCNPTARAVAGLLLLSKASRVDAAAVLQERFDIATTAATLDFYTPIFWDVEAMGRTHWVPFIERLLRREEKHFLSMGLSSPSLAEVRHILGLQSELDPNMVVRNIMNQAHFRFQAAMDQPLPDEHQAFKWAELALKAAHEINNGRPTSGPGSGGPGETAGHLAGDRMFSVRLERSPILALTELQGDVSPTPTPTMAEAKSR